MSDANDTATINDLRTNVKPSDRWRNRYRALRNFGEENPYPYVFRRAGEDFWASCPGWPSRDIAETNGQAYEAKWPHWVRYLGAFPIEEPKP